MKIADANVVLRYLLNDSEEMSEKAAELLEHHEVYIPNEVIAEIVYVLQKVYKVKNSEISETLMLFLDTSQVQVDDPLILNTALNLFAERKLDFVDTLLYAYQKVGNHEIYTFDKKLNNLLK
ncbi:type II toxin-antitoxin system VapC family toxin [Sporosarcina sp. ACRSM]|uniref:PIN domain-containing protein n=1 Tax=Sporosarcina sp. ACRSM TaxID=2918216 RepID=UPI001EF3F9BA|nr:type II toxin-antitoxin system VapC family toxin [Sporosarcina sp. ACRSM]MCG7335929.1 type II toxin-antitoxin system VapC family toxin [Sporosarcina sp. ACRSM]